MWHLQNDSDEILEVIETIDVTVPGCRLHPIRNKPITHLLGPDKTLCISYYEPGVSLVVRPREGSEKPRRLPMSERMKSIQKPVYRKKTDESKRQTDSRVD